MTEKEKMLQQMLYNANYDAELIEERRLAKELCYDYNALRPSDEEGQQELLDKLLGKKGKVVASWPHFGATMDTT